MVDSSKTPESSSAWSHPDRNMQEGFPFPATGFDLTDVGTVECSGCGNAASSPVTYTFNFNLKATLYPCNAGHLRLFPSGTPLPLVSTVNCTQGQTRANNAVVAVGTSGGISVYCGQSAGTAHVIVDVDATSNEETGRHRTSIVNGPRSRFLSDDHRRLDALLDRAMAVPGRIDLVAFGEFRGGILRHIGMEEKVLIPAARRARGGEALPIAAKLRVDHGAIAAMLVPTPTPAIVADVRAFPAPPLNPYNDSLVARHIRETLELARSQWRET